MCKCEKFLLERPTSCSPDFGVVFEHERSATPYVPAQLRLLLPRGPLEEEDHNPQLRVLQGVELLTETLLSRLSWRGNNMREIVRGVAIGSDHLIPLEKRRWGPVLFPTLLFIRSVTVGGTQTDPDGTRSPPTKNPI